MKRIDVQINHKLAGTCEAVIRSSSPLFKDIIDPPVSPSLTDDQQVVLDYLKKMCPPELGVSAMVTTYCLVDIFVNDNWQEYPEHIEALQKLSVAEENQVLTAFAEWSRRKSDG